MPKKRYRWDLSAPPSIGAHSLAKHRILRQYLHEYVRVLTQRTPGMEVLELSIVDGFAGGGLYRADDGSLVDGSPLIAIDALRAAEVEINQDRRKPLSVRAKFYFVDEAQDAMACLRTLLDRRVDIRRDCDGASVHTFQKQFENALPAIVSDIRGGRRTSPRAIFILDQYGYTDVPAGLLKKIFTELPRAEAFVTIAVGWIAAYLRDLDTIGKRLGVPPERVRALADALENEDSLDARDSKHHDTFFLIQRLLRDAFIAESSLYYTPFFIVSRQSNRAYWLLHLANNATAHDVVKSLHWKNENHFQHFGKAGLDMLGFDPERETSRDTAQRSFFFFDDDAKARTRGALHSPLADLLASAGPLPFNDLFARVCNETPATKEIVGRSLNDLAREGAIDKRGKDGQVRAANTPIRADDVLYRSPQLRLLR